MIYYKMTRKPINKSKEFINKRFGRLIIISVNTEKDNGNYYWLAQCDCGNQKLINSRSIKTGRVISCGCYSKEINKIRLTESNKKRSGENHPNWDPTKSNKERFILRKNKISYLREETFKRDNYTCQCCDKKGVILNAHHILPFSKYVELRYDVNNLITLCYECHKKYHSTYKQNITLKTLDNFVKNTINV